MPWDIVENNRDLGGEQFREYLYLPDQPANQEKETAKKSPLEPQSNVRVWKDVLGYTQEQSEQPTGKIRVAAPPPTTLEEQQAALTQGNT